MTTTQRETIHGDICTSCNGTGLKRLNDEHGAFVLYEGPCAHCEGWGTVPRLSVGAILSMVLMLAVAGFIAIVAA